jgi:cell division protein FtsW (lipid II flippase)
VPGRLQRELSLTFFAAALLIGGYAASWANLNSVATISTSQLRTAALLGAMMLLVPIIWAAARMAADDVIFPVCALLLAIGLVAMRRLQPDIGGPDSDLGNLSGRHTVYVILSVIVMAGVGRWFPFWAFLRRYKYLTVGAAIGLLLVTLVAGRERYGARLWLGIGPFEIQTSELIKIGLILFLAAYLHEKHEMMHGRWQLWRLSLPPVPYLIPLVLLLLAALLMVVAMNDLGTALLLFSTALAMLYVALRRISYVVISLAAFFAGSAFAYVTFDRVGIRVQNWLDPWRDPFVTGYQQIQADYAMSSGGLFGTGIGRGEPWRIPAVHTDYIFAAIVEEWGALGGLVIIILFGVLLFRGLRIASRADSLYDRYLAVGLSASIAIQAIVIIGGVLRLLPLTGVTLPFVSAGGTSLLLNALSIGMLLNISHRQRAAQDGGDHVNG